ncbi:hypothetical protein V1512DRAFT_220473 [Lipomyces arxii]|uniref:uncharacterized protein n=1 Tax=Lipomyces arxii TaxID=56418 RepID=UPI0034CFB316
MGNSAGKEQHLAVPSSRVGQSRRHSSASEISTSSRASADRDGRAGLAAVTSSKIRHALNLDEMVDGGFLVPQGVYTGLQDFKARIVRQLQIERRLAPFFKAIDDYDDNWTDAQLIAAVRGLPIPAASSTPAISSSPEITNRARSQSNVESREKTRPRSNTVSSLTGDKKRSALEAALYRGAVECPICFLCYPPYLNSTRCCDQPICSECFVQIKRSDPHVPEHEEADNEHGESTTPFGMVEFISEPACCPYCAEPDFGVTYTPPPFRSGISSSSVSSGLRSLSRQSSATASAASLTSVGSGSPGTPSSTGSKRRQTLPSSAPEVVTTDRIRPDWALKLANANAHAARRAAAATALHSAAFMSDENGVHVQRPAVGSRRSSGSSSTSGASGRSRLLPRTAGLDIFLGSSSSSSNSQGRRFGTNPRRPRRMVDLEEMMVMEAIRISLLEDEERQTSDIDTASRASEQLRQRRQSNTATSPVLPSPLSNVASVTEAVDSVETIGGANESSGEIASGSSASLASSGSDVARAVTQSETSSASSLPDSGAAASNTGGVFGSLTGTLLLPDESESDKSDKTTTSTSNEVRAQVS